MHSCFRFLVLSISFAIAVVLPAAAADIYVSSTNGDDAFDGSRFEVLGGGVGPKQTLEGALDAATTGDVIFVEAGTYGPSGGLLTVDKAVTFRIEALGSEVIATISGDLVVMQDITVSGGANALAVGAGGNLILRGGDLTVISPGDLVLPDGVTITREHGAIRGNAPSFGANTFVVYNDDDPGQSTTAGLELPADLGSGTITIDQASGSLDFPNPISLSGLTVAPGTSVDVTLFSTVSSRGDARRSDGATGDLTFTDLELFDNHLVNAESGGTLSVLGTLSFTANTNDEVAKPAIDNAAGGTMALGNVVFSGVAGPNPGLDQMRLLVNGVGGSVTVREEIRSVAVPTTNEATTQVNDVDVAIFQNRGEVIVRGSAQVEHVYNTHADARVEFHAAAVIHAAVAPGLSPNSINNVLGRVEFYDDATIEGALINASGQRIVFNGNAGIDGDVNNAGTIEVGPSLTVELTSNGDFTEIGLVSGADGSVVVSGDGAVGMANVEGNLTISGNGNLAASLTVGGNLVVSGSGAITSALAVAGNLELTGSNSFGPGAAGTDVGGNLVVDGLTEISLGASPDPGVAAGGVQIRSGGDLRVAESNTLVVRGSFDDSQGGAFSAAGPGATLSFELTDDATWTPGTNRQVDRLMVAGPTHTLTMLQSVDVLSVLMVSADATVDVTDKLIRLSSVDGRAQVDGTVLASRVTGALTFKANDQELSGMGQVTNLTVNNGDDTPSPLALASDMTVTNKLQLFDGGLDLAGNVLTLGAPPARIERNMAGTATEIVDSVGGGSLAGTYDLLYSGDISGPVDVAREFSASGINSLTVATSGGVVRVVDPGSWGAATLISIAENIEVLPDATLDLSAGLGFLIGGAVAISDGGTLTGSDVLNLAGSDSVHLLHGAVQLTSPVIVSGTNARIEGPASDGTVAGLGVGELPGLTVRATGVNLVQVHAIRGDLTLDAGSELALGLAAVEGSDTNNGVVTGNLVMGGQTLTLTTDLTVQGSVLHTAGLVNMADSRLVMETDGSSFTAVPGVTGIAYQAAGGHLDLSGAVLLDVSGRSIPRVRVRAPITLASDWRIERWLDADANIAGPFRTVIAGDAWFASSLTMAGILETVGTTLTLEGDMQVTSLEINSATTTLLASDNGDRRTLFVARDFVLRRGTLNLGVHDLNLNANLPGAAPALTYHDGAVTGSGRVIFDDNTDGSFIPVATGGGDLTIPNVTLRVAGGEAADLNDGISIAAGDGITVTGTLTLQGGAIEFDDTLSPALTLGDGATIHRILGALLDTPTFGALVNNVYDRAVLTGTELALSGGLLDVNANLVLAAGARPTFQTVDLNARLDASVQDATSVASLNVASGGSVLVGIQDPLTEAYSSDGPITLVYDGPVASPGTTLREWPASVEVARLILRSSVDLGGDHTAQHVTVEGVDLDLAGDHALRVTGDLTLSGAASLSNTQGAPGSTGVLEFAGDKPQLVTLAGAFSPGTTASPTGFLLSVDNTAGVTVTGGHLEMDAPTERVRFVQGALDVTDAGLTLFHTDSDNQGFVMVRGGAIGPISKEVVNANIPGFPPVSSRMEYPFCGLGCDAPRSLALTLNDPSQVGGTGRTGILLTATHVESSPGGESGLPIATTDPAGNALTVTRYPDFHWTVAANVLLPLIDYDVEMRAGGYADFAAEQIDRVVGIRREAPATSAWELLGAPDTYGNYQLSPTDPVVVARSSIGDFDMSPGALFTLGLESTITVTHPGAVNMQVGESARFTLDGGVFSGGNPGDVFTYTVGVSNAAIATASESGGELTISGVSKGFADVNVTATDALGNTRTIVVRVNVGFVVSAVQPVVQHIGGSAQLDLSTVVQGGATPYTYVVTVGNVAVATAEMNGDVLTVTAVGEGTTTVTVDVTDADGAVARVEIPVIVTAAVFVSDALADVNLRVGQPAITTDLTSVFSGSTSALTFSVSSSDDAMVLAAVDQQELSILTLQGSREGVPVLVRVTARDGLGNEAIDEFEVVPLPRWGDGNVDDAVSALDARLALQHNVGQIRQQPDPLTSVQLETLNVTGASLTAFDAARILQHHTGFISCFNVEPGCTAELEATGSGVLSFAEAVAEGGDQISVPVTLSGDVRDVFAFQFVAELDPAQVTFLSANTDLPFGWVSEQSLTPSGVFSMAIAGPTAISDPGAYVTLKFQLTGTSGTAVFRGEGFINEQIATELGSVSTSAEATDLPAAFALHGNYPNPFNPATRISVDMPEAGSVVVTVVDVLGRVVLTHREAMVEAGYARAIGLDGSALASGTYMYRVQVQRGSTLQAASGTMTIVR